MKKFIHFLTEDILTGSTVRRETDRGLLHELSGRLMKEGKEIKHSRQGDYVLYGMAREQHPKEMDRTPVLFVGRIHEPTKKLVGYMSFERNANRFLDVEYSLGDPEHKGLYEHVIPVLVDKHNWNIRSDFSQTTSAKEAWKKVINSGRPARIWNTQSGLTNVEVNKNNMEFLEDSIWSEANKDADQRHINNKLVFLAPKGSIGGE